MATKNSINSEYINNADGAQIKGGVILRLLKWLGSDITLTGSGSAVYTFPATTSTLAAVAAVTSLTATGTTTATTETFYKLDATTAAFTVTLITAVGNTGLILHFKKTDSTTNGITLDANTTQTIDLGLTAVISKQNSSISIISDGSNWLIF